MSVGCLPGRFGDHLGLVDALTPAGITNSLYFNASSGAMRGARKRTPCEWRRASLMIAFCCLRQTNKRKSMTAENMEQLTN